MPTASDEKKWLLRLPKELYDAWKVLARSQGVSSPALLHRVMRALLARQGTEVEDASADTSGSSGKLHLTLPKEVVEVARVSASRSGRSLSGWIGSLIRTASAEVQEQQPLYTGNDRRKQSVQLTEAETLAAKAQAKAEGYSLSAWLSTLIRARLRSRPIHTTTELEALSKSTLQLAALGRNLNSAVYRLQREDRWYAESVDLKALGESVTDVVHDMNALIDRAGERGRF